MIIFVIVWWGGAIFLYLRLRMTQQDYFSRFDDTIYYPFGIPLFFRPVSARAAWRIMRVTFQQQTDPSLESLRRKIFRRWLQMGAWGFGFPILVVGVIALSTQAGFL